MAAACSLSYLLVAVVTWPPLVMMVTHRSHNPHWRIPTLCSLSTWRHWESHSMSWCHLASCSLSCPWYQNGPWRHKKGNVMFKTKTADRFSVSLSIIQNTESFYAHLKYFMILSLGALQCFRESQAQDPWGVGGVSPFAFVLFWPLQYRLVPPAQHCKSCLACTSPVCSSELWAPASCVASHWSQACSPLVTASDIVGCCHHLVQPLCTSEASPSTTGWCSVCRQPQRVLVARMVLAFWRTLAATWHESFAGFASLPVDLCSLPPGWSSHWQQPQQQSCTGSQEIRNQCWLHWSLR